MLTKGTRWPRLLRTYSYVLLECRSMYMIFYHLLYMYVYSKKIGRRSWDLIKKEEKQKNKIENKKLRIKERIIEKGKKKKREKKKKRNERKREIALKLDKWERNATRIIIKIEKDGLTRLRRVEGVVVELGFGIEIMARRVPENVVLRNIIDENYCPSRFKVHERLNDFALIVSSFFWKISRQDSTKRNFAI